MSSYSRAAKLLVRLAPHYLFPERFEFISHELARGRRADWLADAIAEKRSAVRESIGSENEQTAVAQLQAEIAALETESAMLRRDVEESQKYRRFTMHLGVFLTCMQPVMFALFWNWLFSFKDAYAQQPFHRTFGTVMMLGWGVGLFVLRRNFRRIYGACEFFVAVVFAQTVADVISTEGGMKGALQGSAAVYLTVRAIDNLTVGHREAIAAMHRIAKSAEAVELGKS